MNVRRWRAQLTSLRTSGCRHVVQTWEYDFCSRGGLPGRGRRYVDCLVGRPRAKDGRTDAVACSMASAGFAACMGASPETVLQVSSLKVSL